MENISKKNSEFNKIIKENDELYHEAAKKFGLPDCAFWIIYSLRDCDSYLTQSEVCNIIYQPKQTVNSALKKLEREGYIEFESASTRRSKYIRLTPLGIAFSRKTIDRVIALEQKALSGLSEAEQNAFMELFRKYTDLFKSSMHNLQLNETD
ncbi:MAG: winged helix-turn-helix transcriptional regulator [Clostridiales bacterium]|nr:winged helix-turn-helix transcriptional regulator [Clostridiales bacterium]